MQSVNEQHWQHLKPGKTATYLLATRPKFYTASVLPVLLGTAWGYLQTGHLNTTGFLLALAAIVCVHACINVLNDVYDDLNGTDRINTARIFPFTGGSRFIQEGLLSRQQMFRWGLSLALASAVFGAALSLREGWPVLWLGIAGLGLGVLYSAPPVALAGRGVGELAVALGCGVLPVVGAAWVQTHVWDPQAFLLSVPIAIWVGCILLINEIPDRMADAASGKRTLVVRLGVPNTLRLYIAVNSLALAAVAAMVWLSMLPLLALLLPALLTLLACRVAAGNPPQDSRDAMTALIHHTLLLHMLGGLWLTGCLLPLI